MLEVWQSQVKLNVVPLHILFTILHSKHCNTELLLRAGLICALCRCTNTWHVYAVRMSPALNRSSALQCFKCGNVIKRHNVIILAGTATNVQHYVVFFAGHVACGFTAHGFTHTLNGWCIYGDGLASITKSEGTQYFNSFLWRNLFRWTVMSRRYTWRTFTLILRFTVKEKI